MRNDFVSEGVFSNDLTWINTGHRIYSSSTSRTRRMFT